MEVGDGATLDIQFVDYSLCDCDVIWLIHCPWSSQEQA